MKLFSVVFEAITGIDFADNRVAVRYSYCRRVWWFCGFRVFTKRVRVRESRENSTDVEYFI